MKNTTVNWPFDPEEYGSFRETIWPVVDAVPGFLSSLEAFFLYQTAKTVGGSARGVDQPAAGSIVEIGSYKGRSSVALGLGIKDNPAGAFRLTCVDPFFNDQIEPGLKAEFLNHISQSGVDTHVTCIPDYSMEAVKEWPPSEGISMLFIDGNHEFEFARDDFLSWSRFLVPGGVVAFHDSYLTGVRNVIDQHLFPNEAYQDVSIVDGNLVAARKVDSPPDARQRAIKQRVFWTLRTGRTSPWNALVRIFGAWLDRPFGSLRRFFVERVPTQRL